MPMFTPSGKDEMAVNWKNGLPSLNYNPKMKEDKNYIYD